jgi:hypothetical protein
MEGRLDQAQRLVLGLGARDALEAVDHWLKMKKPDNILWPTECPSGFRWPSTSTAKMYSHLRGSCS